MSATLKDLPPTLRIGATVIAPDGRRAAVWAYTETPVRGPAGNAVGTRAEAWLWRDGALLDPVPEREARALPLVTSARIYRDGARACTRRDHPEASQEASECPTCGLPIRCAPGCHDWPDFGSDVLCQRCGAYRADEEVRP